MSDDGRRFPRAIPCLIALWLVAGTLFLWHTPKQALADVPTPMLFGSAPNEPDSQLQAIVQDVVGNLPGDWGVAVKKLDTGQFAVFNGDTQQVAASLYKLWVVSDLFYEAKIGNISLDDYGTVTDDDAVEDTALNDLRIAPGSSISMRSAARAMITVSDNTAGAFLLRKLGPDRINASMQKNGLTRSVLDLDISGDNLTTPIDMLHELEMMATSKMVDAASSQQIVSYMLGQQINDRLPVGLPPEAKIAHKTGDLDYLLHDVGIVYGPSGPFIIVAMSSNLYSNEEGFTAMPELARRVYNYFNDNPSSPARYFPETRQTVAHDFLKFWNDYGGLDSFGYPLGPEQLENGILVQYFERARFEIHPELANIAAAPQPEIALGLLGAERAAQLGLHWGASPESGTGLYFSGTGQEISGDFLDYWQDHGGERVFGWPISPAADMVNPADGNTYFTQWFQRARFEYHPELPVGHRIVLGTLGSELYSHR